MSHIPQRHWTGDVNLQPGIGVFIGQSGDNQEHRHWSHQISIGLDGEIGVNANGQNFQSNAFFIKAGTLHQLVASPVISIYIDPTTVLAQTLSTRLGEHSAICELPKDMVVLFRSNLIGCISLEVAIANLNIKLASHITVPTDLRLQNILSTLVFDVSAHTVSCRKALAEQVGLSETRFSHWFSEQTGMPLRSYRKWLRLVYAFEQILHGQTLIHAAYKANFSDQAHFSRTCMQMFGVNPSVIFAHMKSDPKEHSV